MTKAAEATAEQSASSESATFRFSVNMATPSLNETMRWHWARARKEAKAWLLAIWAHVGPNELAEGKRRKLTIERHGKRLLDHDNLVGGMKIAIDSVKKLGLIHDDSPTWLDLEVRQTKLAKGEKPRTTFTIEDA